MISDVEEEKEELKNQMYSQEDVQVEVYNNDDYKTLGSGDENC